MTTRATLCVLAFMLVFSNEPLVRGVAVPQAGLVRSNCAEDSYRLDLHHSNNQGEVVLDGCTFTSEARLEVKVGSTDGNITFKNCIFNDGGIKVKGTYSNGAVLTFQDCHFSANSLLWFDRLTLQDAQLLVYDTMFENAPFTRIYFQNSPTVTNSLVKIKRCNLESGAGTDATLSFDGAQFTDSVFSLEYSNVATTSGNALDFGRLSREEVRFTRGALMVMHNRDLIGTMDDATMKIVNNTFGSVSTGDLIDLHHDTPNAFDGASVLIVTDNTFDYPNRVIWTDGMGAHGTTYWRDNQDGSGNDIPSGTTAPVELHSSIEEKQPSPMPTGCVFDIYCNIAAADSISGSSPPDGCQCQCKQTSPYDYAKDKWCYRESIDTIVTPTPAPPTTTAAPPTTTAAPPTTTAAPPTTTAAPPTTTAAAPTTTAAAPTTTAAAPTTTAAPLTDWPGLGGLLNCSTPTLIFEDEEFELLFNGVGFAVNDAVAVISLNSTCISEPESSFFPLRTVGVNGTEAAALYTLSNSEPVLICYRFAQTKSVQGCPETVSSGGVAPWNSPSAAASLAGETKIETSNCKSLSKEVLLHPKSGNSEFGSTVRPYGPGESCTLLIDPLLAVGENSARLHFAAMAVTLDFSFAREDVAVCMFAAANASNISSFVPNHLSADDCPAAPEGFVIAFFKPFGELTVVGEVLLPVARTLIHFGSAPKSLGGKKVSLKYELRRTMCPGDCRDSSGTSRGSCEGGKCVCDSPWEGQSCDVYGGCAVSPDAPIFTGRGVGIVNHSARETPCGYLVSPDASRHNRRGPLGIGFQIYRASLRSSNCSKHYITITGGATSSAPGVELRRLCHDDLQLLLTHGPSLSWLSRDPRSNAPIEGPIYVQIAADATDEVIIRFASVALSCPGTPNAAGYISDAAVCGGSGRCVDVDYNSFRFLPESAKKCVCSFPHAASTTGGSCDTCAFGLDAASYPACIPPPQCIRNCSFSGVCVEAGCNCDTDRFGRDCAYRAKEIQLKSRLLLRSPLDKGVSGDATRAGEIDRQIVTCELPGQVCGAAVRPRGTAYGGLVGSEPVITSRRQSIVPQSEQGDHAIQMNAVEVPGNPGDFVLNEAIAGSPGDVTGSFSFTAWVQLTEASNGFVFLKTDDARTPEGRFPVADAAVLEVRDRHRRPKSLDRDSLMVYLGIYANGAQRQLDMMFSRRAEESNTAEIAVRHFRLDSDKYGLFDGSWRLLSVTFDEDTMRGRVFVDGETNPISPGYMQCFPFAPTGVSTQSDANSSSVFASEISVFGTRGVSLVGYGLRGALDEVRVYSGAISQATIVSIGGPELEGALRENREALLAMTVIGSIASIIAAIIRMCLAKEQPKGESSHLHGARGANKDDTAAEVDQWVERHVLSGGPNDADKTLELRGIECLRSVIKLHNGHHESKPSEMKYADADVNGCGDSVEVQETATGRPAEIQVDDFSSDEESPSVLTPSTSAGYQRRSSRHGSIVSVNGVAMHVSTPVAQSGSFALPSPQTHNKHSFQIPMCLSIERRTSLPGSPPLSPTEIDLDDSSGSVVFQGEESLMTTPTNARYVTQLPPALVLSRGHREDAPLSSDRSREGFSPASTPNGLLSDSSSGSTRQEALMPPGTAAKSTARSASPAEFHHPRPLPDDPTTWHVFVDAAAASREEAQEHLIEWILRRAGLHEFDDDREEATEEEEQLRDSIIRAVEMFITAHHGCGDFSFLDDDADEWRDSPAVTAMRRVLDPIDFNAQESNSNYEIANRRLLLLSAAIVSAENRAALGNPTVKAAVEEFNISCDAADNVEGTTPPPGLIERLRVSIKRNLRDITQRVALLRDFWQILALLVGAMTFPSQTSESYGSTASVLSLTFDSSIGIHFAIPFYLCCSLSMVAFAVVFALFVADLRRQEGGGSSRLRQQLVLQIDRQEERVSRGESPNRKRSLSERVAQVMLLLLTTLYLPTTRFVLLGVFCHEDVLCLYDCYVDQEHKVIVVVGIVVGICVTVVSPLLLFVSTLRKQREFRAFIGRVKDTSASALWDQFLVVDVSPFSSLYGPYRRRWGQAAAVMLLVKAAYVVITLSTAADTTGQTISATLVLSVMTLTAAALEPYRFQVCNILLVGLQVVLLAVLSLHVAHRLNPDVLSDSIGKAQVILLSMALAAHLPAIFLKLGLRRH